MQLEKYEASANHNRADVKMKKRIDVLDEIKYKYLNLQDVSCGMFLRTLWEYYLKNDLETGDQLSDIFYALYMSDDDLTYDEIVFQYNIALSTLGRYRRRFNNLADKILSSI